MIATPKVKKIKEEKDKYLGMEKEYQKIIDKQEKELLGYKLKESMETKKITEDKVFSHLLSTHKKASLTLSEFTITTPLTTIQSSHVNEIIFDKIKLTLEQQENIVNQLYLKKINFGEQDIGVEDYDD